MLSINGCKNTFMKEIPTLNLPPVSFGYGPDIVFSLVIIVMLEVDFF